MVFLKGKSNHVILCFTSINHLHAPHNKIPALKRGLTRPHMSGLYPPVLHPQNTAPQSGDDVSYLHISASCHSFCSKHVSLNVWKLVFSRSSYRISFLEKSLQDPWRDHHSTHSQIKWNSRWTPSYIHHTAFVLMLTSLYFLLKSRLFDNMI